MKMDSFVCLGKEPPRKNTPKLNESTSVTQHASEQLTDCHTLGRFPDSRFPSITEQRNN